MSAVLTTSALCLHVGNRTLIDNLDLSLDRGQITVILGTNGAGKTTLMETLCGLRNATSGSITLDQKSLDQFAPRALATRIGLMPQQLDHGFDFSVQQRVALARFAQGGLWQWRADADLTASHTALAQVGMESYAARTSASLSGGEKQRVALAMLLAQSPTLMCLDEPFSQLDPKHQRRTCALLGSLRDQGHSVALSVHDMNVAVELADQVLLLYGDGRWRLGPTDEILTAEQLGELYATPVAQLQAPGGASVFTFL